MITMSSKAKETTSPCRHCRAKSGTGTKGGCYNCGKVKHSHDGRKRARY